MSRQHRYSTQLFSGRMLLPLLTIMLMLLTLVLETQPSHGQQLPSDATEGDVSAAASNAIVAFPGAEGFGVQSVGGRGGKVYLVTNLNDSGPGSLRACVEASGPRTCVFRVAGYITLRSSIEATSPYLTIAGQTAPGGGITIRSIDENTEAALKIKTHDVIVRYLRFRPGTVRQDVHVLGVNGGADATGEAAAHNVILDHMSISWGGDEMLILYSQSHDITVQWSTISESLPAPLDGSVAIKGIVLGSDNGPGNYSFHHNVIAHNNQRNPNVDVAGVVDWVNNVVYNWNYSGAHLKLSPRVNFVGNYIKPGPNTVGSTTYIKDSMTGGGYYLSGNVVDTSVRSGQMAPGAGVPARFDTPPITTNPAQTAYARVLEEAGASKGLTCDGTWFYRPDAVDVRIAQSVRDGTRGHAILPAQTYQQMGYISTPADVGGWPHLDPGTPCPDGDNDGMPDAWESAHGLNPNQDDSAQDRNGDGYTNIEEYINGQSNTSSPDAPAPTATPSPTTPAPTSTPTASPTPTGTPQDPPPNGSSGEDVIFVSSTSRGQIGDIVFADEDVLAYDTNTNLWALYFDSSDVLTTTVDVDAFVPLSDHSILLSFNVPADVGTLGLVDDSDIVRFIPTSLGSTTAGSFEWYFDGSDVDLTTDGEDIDAFTLLSDGRLVISTIGSASVTGISHARDEDLLVFQPTKLGENTSGTWVLYFDGSAVELNTSSEDVRGIWIDPTSGYRYLTTKGAFEVPGLSGDGADIFICVPDSAAPDATCTFTMYWDGSLYGFANEKSDAIYIDQEVLQVTSETLAALWAKAHDGAGDDRSANPDEGADDVAEEVQGQQFLLPFVQR